MNGRFLAAVPLLHAKQEDWDVLALHLATADAHLNLLVRASHRAGRARSWTHSPHQLMIRIATDWRQGKRLTVENLRRRASEAFLCASAASYDLHASELR